MQCPAVHLPAVHRTFNLLCRSERNSRVDVDLPFELKALEGALHAAVAAVEADTLDLEQSIGASLDRLDLRVTFACCQESICQESLHATAGQLSLGSSADKLSHLQTHVATIVGSGCGGTSIVCLMCPPFSVQMTTDPGSVYVKSMSCQCFWLQTAWLTDLSVRLWCPCFQW